MAEFDFNANPDSIAARAAELALEQHDRLRLIELDGKIPSEAAIKFYSDPFEITICNKITSLMGAYAVLKGYVTPERAGVRTS